MSDEQPKRQSLTPQEMEFTHHQILNRFVTETGKILPRKITRLSAKQQRKVTKTIKRARNMLMMK
ncbi:MAG: 30S ribosomal protein S18 [Verrucomicrobiota bacterium]